MAVDPERHLETLEDIPYRGPSIASDLRLIGIAHPGGLGGRDPYALYEQLDTYTGVRHDLCALDTLIGALRYIEGDPRVLWWAFTDERKRVLAGTE